jgi:uncharacterized protein
METGLEPTFSSSSAAVERVVATTAALDAIAEIRKGHRGVLFFQSGGCCDGSLPLCFADGEFLVGDRDLLLGSVGGCPFYIDPRQFVAWKNSQLTLDVAVGEPEGFSRSAGPGKHFITRTRICAAGTLPPPDPPPTLPR